MKVFIIDEGLKGELIAAVQSYYSRDPGSAYAHLLKAVEGDPQEFMRKYYKKGYAHKSIAQCGTITIFIEGVSMLFAKALQDSPYYNGQEASTRYINFEEQGFANPVIEFDSHLCVSNISEYAKQKQPENFLEWLNISSAIKVTVDQAEMEIVEEIKNAWMNFYSQNFENVSAMLRLKNPIQEGQKESVYNTAIYSRTCDILRGFLPAGMKTLVSWHTTLDHANDVLKILKHHPATEIRSVSRSILKALVENYPETFAEETTPELEAHYKRTAELVSYYQPKEWSIEPDHVEFDVSCFDKSALEPFKELLLNRPKYGVAHRLMGRAGLIGIKYLQDFGSVRDTLRHRPGINQVPLLTTKYGFEKWYIEQLPENLQGKALGLIEEQMAKIEMTFKYLSEYDCQYVIPLGFLCPMYHNWPFNQLVYVPELRTGPTVHPTAQRPQRAIAHWVKENFREFLGDAYYISEGDGAFSYRRGTQTMLKED